MPPSTLHSQVSNPFAPIGVFDSGVGGLTVLRALRERLPHENLVYLGDTARVPYGNKSEETVTRYALEDTRFLLEHGVKMVVVACNTASALATAALRRELPEVPLLGMIGPGARAALKATRNRRVGVIATAATIASGAYERRIRELSAENGDAEPPRIIGRACPLFVPLVEEGELDSPMARMAAEKYLEPLLREDIDTLVLGCTHYPLLKKVIREIMGPAVTLVDSGEAAAAEAVEALAAKNLLHPAEGGGHETFYVTDAARRFHGIAESFLGHAPERLELTTLNPA